LRVMLNSPSFKGMPVGDVSGEEPKTKQLNLASIENGTTTPLLLRVCWAPFFSWSTSKCWLFPLLAWTTRISQGVISRNMWFAEAIIALETILDILSCLVISLAFLISFSFVAFFYNDFRECHALRLNRRKFHVNGGRCIWTLFCVCFLIKPVEPRRHWVLSSGSLSLDFEY
jgi:hypothetical protein